MLVLLHGSPGASGAWDKLIAEIDGQYRLIVPDLPGFGHSGRDLPDYSSESHAAYLHALLDELGVRQAHVAGCTGSTSEAAVQKLYGLPESAMLDMGDFAGGLLKYLRKHPLPRITIGGLWESASSNSSPLHEVCTTWNG